MLSATTITKYNLFHRPDKLPIEKTLIIDCKIVKNHTKIKRIILAENVEAKFPHFVMCQSKQTALIGFIFGSCILGAIGLTAAYFVYWHQRGHPSPPVYNISNYTFHDVK